MLDAEDLENAAALQASTESSLEAESPSDDACDLTAFRKLSYYVSGLQDGNGVDEEAHDLAVDYYAWWARLSDCKEKIPLDHMCRRIAAVAAKATPAAAKKQKVEEVAASE